MKENKCVTQEVKLLFRKDVNLYDIGPQEELFSPCLTCICHTIFKYNSQQNTNTGTGMSVICLFFGLRNVRTLTFIERKLI